LKKSYQVIGIDRNLGKNTDIVCDVSSNNFLDKLNNFKNKEIIVINLAAARFDFGATPQEYFETNVRSQKTFLENLAKFKIIKFIHMSSVASIDGRGIKFTNELSCDDSYRATKYLQEKLITDWCLKQNIDLSVLYPSAIFSMNKRSDTNIGKLQSLTRYLPFIPFIDVKKSVTFLPSLCRFIEMIILNEVKSGKYLSIEKPVLSVTDMILILSSKKIKIVNIPFLKSLLMLISKFLYFLGGFGRIDMKLTPNRVEKLFSDTSYEKKCYKSLDIITYPNSSKNNIYKVLESVVNDKIY